MAIKLTKQQKDDILELFKMVDVKKLEIDIEDDTKTKWFRFGSFNGMQIAAEIIKAIDEKDTKSRKASSV